MNTMLCTNTKNADKALLTLSVAARIKQLRQERVLAYAEQRPQTETGRTVDEMLDCLTTLHRLEELAEHVARGGYVSVQADKLLIAANEKTYLEMLEEASKRYPGNVAAQSMLLPSMPTPID